MPFYWSAKALFLAFTGTPLIAGEERTKEVFGDYVSIYDFQQSVEDGATVPLYYENRTPELQLVNPDLNEDIYNLIEAAELDPKQEAKLERELSKQYHILTRDDRVETVAGVLDTGLPRAFDKPLYEQKCSALFEHIYESYPERDTGAYAAGAG